MLLPVTVNLSDLIGYGSVLEGLKVYSRDGLSDVFCNLVERRQGFSEADGNERTPFLNMQFS